MILPKLSSTGTQWFVYYTCRNPKTAEMIRFRHYDGFSGLTAEQKQEHGKKVIELYNAKLRNGWSPFAEVEDIVYTDHLEYRTASEFYGKKRAGNNTLQLKMSEYLAEVESQLAKKTYQTYQSKFRIFNLWLQSRKVSANDISSFTNSDIVEFFRFLIDKRKLSRRSIQKYQQILKMFFAWCQGKKLCAFNPVHDLPSTSRKNDSAPRPIVRADIEIFKDELKKDPELWLAVQLEYYCALRPGQEIRLMKVKDIDLVKGTIRVDSLRAKTRCERIVTMPHQLLLQLRQLGLQDIERDYYVFGRGGIPGEEPIGKNYLRNRFVKVRKLLKMPYEYKFYSWKHTGAVEADEAGISFKDISMHLGHTSLQTTDMYFKNKKPGTSKAIREHYPTL